MLMCISGLVVAYGPIRALEDVSIDVDRGEIVSIIGANGAGKSTLLKSVAGILKPRGGAIFFKEKGEITRERPDRIVKQGSVWFPREGEYSPISRSRKTSELGAHAVKGRASRGPLRSMVLDTFHEWGKGSNSTQAPCPEGNSRCSPSEGPSWATPRYSLDRAFHGPITPDHPGNL